MTSKKNQLAYLKNLPIFWRVSFHGSNFGFVSTKRLVQLSNSCASSNNKKKCDIKSRSQQLELEPLILTLKIWYVHNISITYLFVLWSLTFNLPNVSHLHTHTRIQSQNSQEKPNLCVVPLKKNYYYFFFLGVTGNIDSCRCKCHSAQQSSRNVFGSSYVCAYSHLLVSYIFSFVFIC